MDDIDGIRQQLAERLRENDALKGERNACDRELEKYQWLHKEKCAEVVRLQQQWSDEHDERVRLEERLKLAESLQAESLMAEVARLRAALEFYADERNYTSHWRGTGDDAYWEPARIPKDMGRRAEEALGETQQ